MSIREAIDYFDQWVQFRQGYLRVPGVQVAVQSGGDLMLSSAYGYADIASRTALTTDHLFRIASHSKTFTATAILQLAEAGTLRLDDPVSAWVDYLADTALADVTIRELLAHQSGIIRDGQEGDFWQLGRPFLDQEQLRDTLLDSSAAVLPPNERFKYSNITYSLLGLIVESAAGMPYNQFVTEHIVNRLGLTKTGPELDQERLDEYATGYSCLAYANRRIPIEHVDTRAMSAATGFYSTASDLVKYFASHFLGDPILLSDRWKRQMQQPISDVVDGDNYGLGMNVRTVGDRKLIGHGGGYPGHITASIADSEAGVAVTVLTNAIDGPADQLAVTAFKLIDLAGSNDSADGAARFTGRYASLWGVLDIVALGDKLYAINPAAPDPTELLTELEIVDQNSLRVTKTSGTSSFGETWVFDFAPDGAVRSFAGGSGMTQVPLATIELPDHFQAGVPNTFSRPARSSARS